MNRVLVSKSNFRVLESILESMQEYDIEGCKELLAGLDEKSAERFDVMAEDYGAYIESVEEISVDEDAGIVTAAIVSGGAGDEYLLDLLKLFGPHADSAKCSYEHEALLHGPEQIADLPVPVVESPGAVRIGHPERSHLVEYLAPNSVFNSLPRQRSSPHLGPDDRFVTVDRVLHHASLRAA